MYFVMGMQEIAGLIGAEAKEVIFTSGATESNNTALKGVANFYGGKKKHIITTQIEHKVIIKWFPPHKSSFDLAW